MGVFANNNNETIAIDKRRLVFERKLFSNLQALSNIINTEIVSSFKTSRTSTINKIIDEYEADIISTLKQNYREAFKVFGTWNRNKLNFLNKEKVYNTTLEIKADVQDVYNIKLSNFVNDSSQVHASYIINTIKEDTYHAISNSQTLIQNEIADLESKRAFVRRRLTELSSINFQDKKLLSERNKLLNQIQYIEKRIQNLEENKESRTINTLASTLHRKNTSRNDMRAFQEVSYAQTQSMQLEAESMEEEDANIITGVFAGLAVSQIIYKEWDAIRDSKTRPHHVLAHGQKRKVSEMFEVGGELGLVPGDDSFSLVNKARCRCHVVYGFDR